MNLRLYQRRACDDAETQQRSDYCSPLGGAKTITMIQDAIDTYKAIDTGCTITVVAPRILLAEQLCSEFLELISIDNYPCDARSQWRNLSLFNYKSRENPRFQ